MAQQEAGGHEAYYVPSESKLPVWLAFGLGVMLYGLGAWMNSAQTGGHGKELLFVVGFVVVAIALYRWFAAVIEENHRGMNSAQVKRSYVWGMGWFIFSEVMFFAAFFGALFYIRFLALPWLGGEGEKGITGQYLWPDFTVDWNAGTNPHPQWATPDATLAAPPLTQWLAYLPFYNTVVLLTSSVTIHVAHTALKEGNRSKLNLWLGITVALGILFLILQMAEYVHAYRDLGLTLNTGIYGSTFFLLTGFHGFHVTLGTFMLIVMLARCLKGHFTKEDHFGFEATAWYWHFVDVVWLGLFLFVYVF
ncbi:MAG: cytochrome c oxidase subunit 3 [Gammaproteobacteria bacterium]|nr:cytochrome c oxidase subunit 3 [Gammaproteobacteria bacterium]